MSAFWPWFVSHGDDLLLLITLAAAEAQREALLPPSVMKWVIYFGAVATIAHKIFFPNAQGPTAPKA